MIFDLPDVLIVERAGRAMALKVDSAAEMGVSTSIAGAAALAAARLLKCRGIPVKIIFTDGGDMQLDIFDTYYNVATKMDMNVKVERGDDDFPCVISGTDATATMGSENFVVAKFFIDSQHPRQWDGWRMSHNPYLRKADKESAISVEDAREIDRIAKEVYDFPTIALMENAGVGAAVVVDALIRNENMNGNILVVAGVGNNGGDAFVVARGLIERGMNVKVVLCGEPQTDDARVNYEILEQASSVIHEYEEDSFNDLLAQSQVVVDGMLGTGVDREIGGVYKNIIDAVNSAGKSVVSLDIPSGLNGNNGEVMGCAVKADITVTFAKEKVGLFSDLGAELCGEIVVADIGAPSL